MSGYLSLSSNKFKFTMLMNDSITKHLEKNDLWEPHMVKFMSMYIQPGFNCLDVGSCFGYHALHMARLANDGITIAYEPFSVAYNLLCKNVMDNKMKNIVCKNLAVGHVNKSLYLGNAYNDENHMNIGDSFVFEDNKETEVSRGTVYRDNVKLAVNKFKIECVTLDSEPDMKIDFIKMDVQGYEINALRGAKNLLLRYKPVIAIELEESCGLLCHNIKNISELYDCIREFGYEIYFLEHEYPCDHICVHKDNRVLFDSIFKDYIKDHIEDNDINRNLSNGVTKKISLNY